MSDADPGSLVPSDVRRLAPSMDADGFRTFDRLLQHEAAPRWTITAGDRLEAADLDALDALRDRLASGRRGFDPSDPPDVVLAWVEARRGVVAAFRERIPEGLDLVGHWPEIATTSRDDVAARPETLVPDDADLGRSIVYRTAGTTGHALLVLHHPVAAASYQPLLEVALARHGARPRLERGRVGCVLVGAQRHTVTYPTALAAWDQTGFAKLNLHPDEWRERGDRRRFLEDAAPELLTGDPISFAELLGVGPSIRPAAIVSTAVAMSEGLRRTLVERFGCPVIDWYSLTETGPIGYRCPEGEAYHVVADDVFVEALAPDGSPVAAGERGEITVTGGRNPYLPLLRYRTGDYGRVDGSACPCGDPMPRIHGLEGREPVAFRAADGSIVNPVDLSRVLRELPLVQHEVVQRADRSVEVVVRPIPGGAVLDPDAVVTTLERVLGEVGIDVRVDASLGDREPGRKTFPYRSELPVEGGLLED